MSARLGSQDRRGFRQSVHGGLGNGWALQRPKVKCDRSICLIGTGRLSGGRRRLGGRGRYGWVTISRILRFDRQRPKVLDELLTRDLNEPHVVRLGILESASIVPVVVGDVVGRNDGAGAICPAQAMHKDRATGRIQQDWQDLEELRFGGRYQTRHRNVK